MAKYFATSLAMEKVVRLPSSNRIVAGDHNGLDAHFPQICEFFLHTLLDNILQIDNAENLVVLSHNQRCAALGRNRLDNSITV